MWKTIYYLTFVFAHVSKTCLTFFSTFLGCFQKIFPLLQNPWSACKVVSPPSLYLSTDCSYLLKWVVNHMVNNVRQSTQSGFSPHHFYHFQVKNCPITYSIRFFFKILFWRSKRGETLEIAFLLKLVKWSVKGELKWAHMVWFSW